MCCRVPATSLSKAAASPARVEGVSVASEGLDDYVGTLWWDLLQKAETKAGDSEVNAHRGLSALSAEQ